MSFSYSIATRRYRCAYSHASKLTNHTGVISLLQLKSTKNDARFLNPRRHTFSSSSAATNNAQSKNNNTDQHTPALPIRIALVSSTTTRRASNRRKNKSDSSSWEDKSKRYKKESWLMTRQLAELDEWDVSSIKDQQRDVLSVMDLVWS